MCNGPSKGKHYVENAWKQTKRLRENNGNESDKEKNVSKIEGQKSTEVDNVVNTSLGRHGPKKKGGSLTKKNATSSDNSLT